MKFSSFIVRMIGRLLMIVGFIYAMFVGACRVDSDVNTMVKLMLIALIMMGAGYVLYELSHFSYTKFKRLYNESKMKEGK